MSEAAGTTSSFSECYQTGAVLSYRTYREVELPGTTPFLFAEGAFLRYHLAAESSLMRVPEHHFDVRASGTGSVGKLFLEKAPLLTQFLGGIRTRWLPKARSELTLELAVRGGTTAGAATLEELFLIGAERDTDLWLRGHRGTRDGKKGSGFMGRHFLLVNHDLTQVIVEKPWFSIALGPFIDAGVVSDGPEGLGSKGMVVDVGLQTELRVMTGFALRLSYGRDLRDGNHVFYASYAP